MPLDSLPALRRRAQELGPRTVAVVVADDAVALSAIAQAIEQHIATAVLIGNADAIRHAIDRAALPALHHARIVPAAAVEQAAQIACDLARAGEADVLLKGHLRSDQLLRALLDKERGLRIGRLLSDVLFYEDTLSGRTRLAGVTDGGINVAPTLEQKRQILLNGVEVLHALGFARPKVAAMSATEAVSESVPSTVDARALTEMGERGELGECEVFGPLALDNALLRSAAEAKGITSPVAGAADLMVLPNIEAGNVLGKAVKYLGGSECAHVVVGARVPVLIPSRVESTADKLNSVALGVIAAAGRAAAIN